MLRTIIIALCFTFISPAAKGHEFWIDPVLHFVESGERIEANIRVGEKYEGSAYAYIPRNIRRFDYAFQGEISPVEGTVGDRPAMALDAPGEGLIVAIHATGDSQLTWSEYEKFVAFLEHKDLDWALAEHDARGLSREGIREQYSRYAKSLIAVGDGEGSDAVTGMITEIVALENPYTGETADGLDILALYDGEPLKDQQIEVFRKAPDGTVEITLERTDDAGRATIPVEPGNRYMLDAVVLRPLEVVEERDPSWESLWANLTFEVPAD